MINLLRRLHFFVLWDKNNDELIEKTTLFRVMRQKYDELIELSKKKLGPGKIADGGIILDLINKEVIKCDMPGVAETQILSYTKIYDYFRKYYAEAIDQFIK